MNAYRKYMDGICLTGQEHAALMASLERTAQRGRSPFHRLAVLCACCALACLALWRTAPPPATAGETPAASADVPRLTADPTLTAADPRNTPESKLYSEPDPGGPLPYGVNLPWPLPELAKEEGRGDYDIGGIGGEGIVGSRIYENTVVRGSSSGSPLLDHLPQDIPEGFTFVDGLTGEDGEGRPWRTGRWEGNGGKISVFLQITEEVPASETPAVSADDEIPLFLRGDITEEVLSACARSADGGHKEGGRADFTFRILYPDGVLAFYRLTGLTVQETLRLIL